MLIIRLQRIGKKKQPSYRLIVSEKKRDTQGRYTEDLGTYNPQVNPKVINFKKDRIEYWLGVGAQTSPTVHNLFVGQGIVKEKKRQVVFLSGKRKAKLEKEKAAAAPATPPAAPAATEPAK